MQPRIYTYKVTFEEIPDWYWGVHKEKKYGEPYLGSPDTHAWKWEFYTPYLQICEIFPYTDEGWNEACKIEKRCIKPDLNNPLCLNENVGGHVSLEIRKKNGVVSGNNHVVNQTGFLNPSYLSSDKRKEDYKERGLKTFSRGTGCFQPGAQSRGGVTSGNTHALNGTGVCGQTPEKMTENGLKGGSISGPITVSNKTGIYSPEWRESEEYFAHQRKIALQKWMDPNHPELGKHNAGVLVRKQKKLGYSHGKENRVRVG
jgi:hypothetical protein